MKHSPYITWAKKHHDITYNLASSGVPRPSLGKWIHNTDELLDPVQHENGWAPLMKTIAQRYDVKPRQVIPVHSASFANHLVCALFLDPGVEVLVEDPTYEPLVSLPKYFNATVNRFSRDPNQGYQPDPKEIEELLTPETKLLILSNLHNPSGTLLDEVILWRLIDLAEKYNFHILIDEVYLEFLYPEGERTAAKHSSRIVTTRSLTKAYGLDDLRVGWIIAESILAEKLRRLQDLFITSMASSSERMGLMVLEQADAMLNANISLLKYNYQMVEEFIAEHQKLSWQKPGHGSVGFVKYSGGNVDMLAGYLIENYDTVIAPGYYFGAPEYFRIGWGLPPEELEKGLENLRKVIA
ncbi:MAG: aminotransferase class I/II-fold pyridoxal phosphate-dependent enzyme [Balneolaceae bacterium]|jgi:hypothetical protein